MTSLTVARQRGAAKARMLHMARTEGRRERYRELRDQRLKMQQAADQLGVSHRAAQRYEKHLRDTGWRPPAPEIMPRAAQLRILILAHLAAFPDSTFSDYQLARAADPFNKPATVRDLLMRLSAEGVVELVMGQHDPGVDLRPARRYRLAVAREMAS